MSALYKRLVLWSSIVLLVLLLLAAAFWPRALPVDAAIVVAAPMMLTVGDEGETRVVDVYSVSAPITGTLRRIEVEPGQSVVAGQTLLAEIEPVESELLDPRTEAEAEAQLSASSAAEKLAQAEVDKASSELRFAESEVQRSRELAREGTVSQRDLEASERAFETASSALAAARANLQVRRFELERVRARLLSTADINARRPSCDCISITAPVDGQILRVLRESEGFVAAGETLIELGNPERLEVVADLLSVDAVKVKAGNRAMIEGWGGDGVLSGQVRSVEPFGFTKTSALGIEEQRVNVVLDIVSPPEKWESLGHGYQVDVRIVLWEDERVLQVPLTSLFRDGDDWAIFVNEAGRAKRRIVDVGRMTSDHAQVLSGLSAGEEIVVYPSEGVDDDVRIVAR